ALDQPLTESDPGTYYTGGTRGYVDYPSFLGEVFHQRRADDEEDDRGTEGGGQNPPWASARADEEARPPAGQDNKAAGHEHRVAERRLPLFVDLRRVGRGQRGGRLVGAEIGVGCRQIVEEVLDVRPGPGLGHAGASLLELRLGEPAGLGVHAKG